MSFIVKTNPDTDLVAAFLASKHPVVVPTGHRAYTPAEMRRRTEGDNRVQVKYLARLIGEDGVEWTEEVAANSPQHVLDIVARQWPEARCSVEMLRPMYY